MRRSVFQWLWLSRWLWLLAFGAGCGGKEATLSVAIVTPVGVDPFSDVAQVKLQTGSSIKMVPVTGGHFNLSFKLASGDVNSIASVILDGLSSTGAVVSHGETPPLSLAASNGTVYIYVTRPSSLSQPAAA
jgi:hypothetical protein